MKLIAGIDEAGRGPVIGPMVIAGILVDEGRVHELLKAGVKDSKKLTPKKREALLGPIMEIAVKHHVEVISASAIDVTRRTKNLNWIEAGGMARIVDALRPDLAQIGSVDVLPSRFKRMVIEEMGHDQAIECVHHAEDMYPAVAAASIVAKTTRDRLVASLREEYGDFGSGYPSDQKSRNFISEYIASGKQLPPIVRRSWKTVENLGSY